MHTGTVVTKDRLGHEGDGLAVLAGNVLDDVLVKQQIIGHAGERGIGHAHFALTSGGYLMVMQIHFHAGSLHGQHELVAKFLKGVGWRGWEVTADRKSVV